MSPFEDYFFFLCLILTYNPNFYHIISVLQNVVSKRALQFRGNAQHNAQEFLLWLLDRVHEDLNNMVLPSSRPPRKVTKLFWGTLLFIPSVTSWGFDLRQLNDIRYSVLPCLVALLPISLHVLTVLVMKLLLFEKRVPKGFFVCHHRITIFVPGRTLCEKGPSWNPKG